MSFVLPTQEKRPLKRAKLGPPDIYPQLPRQREDDLGADKLKHGYSLQMPSASLNEYDSARQRVDVAHARGALAASMNNIVSMKLEKSRLNTSRKRPTNTPFWHASAKQPEVAQRWFQRLSAGESLSELARRAPVFNRKDGAADIFDKLAGERDGQSSAAKPVEGVPLNRAVWYLKVTSAHYIQEYESKQARTKRGKGSLDPSVDWTEHLVTYLLDLLGKLQEYYGASSADSTILPLTTVCGQGESDRQHEDNLRKWEYCTRLAKYMDSEFLLDRRLFIDFLLEQTIKLCQPGCPDDNLFTPLIPVLFEFLPIMVSSEPLCRRLAYYCARKIAEIYSYAENAGENIHAYCHTRARKPLHQQMGQPGIKTPNALSPNLSWVPSEPGVPSLVANCELHYHLLHALSTVVHVIALSCPAALVWLDASALAPTITPELDGSPLDLLPCALSALPMPPRMTNLKSSHEEIRRFEQVITQRSLAVEARWTAEPCSSSSAQSTTAVILQLIEALDAFDPCLLGSNNVEESFDVVSEVWYDRANESLERFEVFIRVACLWAITEHRSGAYRSVFVARLLSLLVTDFAEQLPYVGEEYANLSAQGCLQSILVDFLDFDAPTDIESPQFSSLMLLFTDLIRLGVFSLNQYVSLLISRGDFNVNVLMDALNIGNLPRLPSATFSSHDSNASGNDFYEPPQTDDVSVNLTKLLASIKDSADGSDAASTPDPATPAGATQTAAAAGSSQTQPASNKHKSYMLHFVIPRSADCGDNEAATFEHERNQRLLFLYSSRKSRIGRKQILRTLTRDLGRMWSKKHSIECMQDGSTKVRRPLTGIDDLCARLRRLPLQEQAVVAENLVDGLVAQLANMCAHSSSVGQHLPCLEHVDIVLTLLERCLCFQSLFELFQRVTEALPHIERLLRSASSQLATRQQYTQSLALLFVGFVRRHRSIFFMHDIGSVAAICAHLLDLLLLCRSFDPDSYICTSTERCLWLFVEGVNTAVRESTVKTEADEDTFRSFQTRFESCRDIMTQFDEKKSNDLYLQTQQQGYSLRRGTTTQPWVTQWVSEPTPYLSSSKLGQLHKQADVRYQLLSASLRSALCSPHNLVYVRKLAVACADLCVVCPMLRIDFILSLSILPRLANAPTNADDTSKDFTLLTDINLSIGLFRKTGVIEAFSLFLSTLVARGVVDFIHLLKVIVKPTMKAYSDSRKADTDQWSRNSDEDNQTLMRALVYLFGSVACEASLPGADGTLARLGGPWPMGERYLLHAAYEHFDVVKLFQVLKAMVLYGDAVSGPGAGEEDKSELSIGEIIGTVSMSQPPPPAATTPKEVPWSVLIESLLTSVLSEEWVRTAFSKIDITVLVNPQEKNLIDNMSSYEQIDRILSKIGCVTSTTTSPGSSTESPPKPSVRASDYQEQCRRVLSSVSVWNLRWCTLQLALIIGRSLRTGSGDQSSNEGAATLISQTIVSTLCHVKVPCTGAVSKTRTVATAAAPLWLLVHLLPRLPFLVVQRVLSECLAVLSTQVDSSTQFSSLSCVAQSAFAQLIVKCVDCNPSSAETVLSAIRSQLERYTEIARSELPLLHERQRDGFSTHDYIRLRLAIVGGLIERAFTQPSVVSEWILLLARLVTSGLLDAAHGWDLVDSAVDIMSLFLKYLYASSDQKSDGTVSYNTVLKLLRRELQTESARTAASASFIEQFVPMQRRFIDITVCKPRGQSTNAANNSATQKTEKGGGRTSNNGSENSSPEHSLKLYPSRKESYTACAWDIIEGKPQANLNQLNAIRIDRMPKTTDALLADIARHGHWRHFKRNTYPGEKDSDGQLVKNPFLQPMEIPIEDGMTVSGGDGDGVPMGQPGFHMGDVQQQQSEFVPPQPMMHEVSGQQQQQQQPMGHQMYSPVNMPPQQGNMPQGQMQAPSDSFPVMSQALTRQIPGQPGHQDMSMPQSHQMPPGQRPRGMMPGGSGPGMAPNVRASLQMQYVRKQNSQQSMMQQPPQRMYDPQQRMQLMQQLRQQSAQQRHDFQPHGATSGQFMQARPRAPGQFGGPVDQREQMQYAQQQQQQQQMMQQQQQQQQMYQQRPVQPNMPPPQYGSMQ